MGKRQIIEAITKEERQQRRQKLGVLRDLVLKPSTIERYQKAFKLFVEYLKGQKQVLSSTKEGLDHQVQEYIEFLWQEGEHLSLVGDTLSSIQHFQPSMKKNLNGSWRFFRTWQRYELPSRSPPFTIQTLHTVLGYLHGLHPQVALGVALAFSCLLRTGELLSLLAKDVMIPRQGHSLVLNLGETKTGARNPHANSVTCHDVTLVTLLKAWKLTAAPTDPLIPWSQAKFRKSFADSLEAFGLAAFQFKPYSLRRGGATELWNCCRSYSAVAHAGRWTSERTVKVYIQDSLALLTALNYKPNSSQQRYIRKWQEVSCVSCVEPRLLKSTKRGRGR